MVLTVSGHGYAPYVSKVSYGTHHGLGYGGLGYGGYGGLGYGGYGGNYDYEM